MALRVALFQLPKQRRRKAPATEGAPAKAAGKAAANPKAAKKTKAAARPKAAGKPKAAAEPTSGGAPKKASAPKASGTPKTPEKADAPAKPKAAAKPKPADRAEEEKKAAAPRSPRTAKKRPASRSRAGASRKGPRPPLLQRDALVPALARGAVLAVALVCMVGFAVALARVTLVPSPASDRLVHTNLRPGASIRAYLDQPALRDSVKQIGGNVLLGVPFGVLLPMLFPRFRGLLRVAAVTALVMVLVETAQGAIVEGRAFDIDDVILNTTGALIGYLLLGQRLGRALHPRREHWWQRRSLTRSRPPARTRR
ncbi:VanZ family protein [Streptomyces sp. NPDC020917]|uniref:VanZ family protein n=1 Tax=Streptomyces sp. NPDC020917 TaxID=3365102 RepID=UPI0037AA219D